MISVRQSKGPDKLGARGYTWVAKKKDLPENGS